MHDRALEATHGMAEIEALPTVSLIARFACAASI